MARSPKPKAGQIKAVKKMIRETEVQLKHLNAVLVVLKTLEAERRKGRRR